jgi:hypothetical protein
MPLLKWELGLRVGQREALGEAESICVWEAGSEGVHRALGALVGPVRGVARA